MTMHHKSSSPAILFDLDGTLIDTVYEHVLAWSAALRRANIAIPNCEIHRRIGMSGGSLVRQVVREQTKKRGSLPIRQLEQWHDTVFSKATRDVQVLPGTNQLLRHLNQAGVRWAIATTGGRQQARRLLRSLKTPPKTVVTGDDIEKAKPSPDVFVLAAGLGRAH